MRVVRVQLGYARTKRRHEPYRSHLPPQDVRTACSTPRHEDRHPIGNKGHAIRLRDRDGEGRPKFEVLDAHGDRVAVLWGRSAAEAACRQLIETGVISR